MYYLISSEQISDKNELIDLANKSFIEKSIHNNVNGYSYNLRSIPSVNLLSEKRKNYIDEDMNIYYISSSNDDFSLDIILNEGIKNEEDVKKYLRIQYRI